MSRVSPRFFFYWKWDVSQRQCSELITEGFPAVSGKPKSKEYGVMRKEKKKTLLYPQPQFPFSDTLSMSWQLVPDPNVSVSGACATFFFFLVFTYALLNGQCWRFHQQKDTRQRWIHMYILDIIFSVLEKIAKKSQSNSQTSWGRIIQVWSAGLFECWRPY